MQVKELESQLLVERKLARQHVDTRIAEQLLLQQKLKQQQQQHEEQTAAAMRPPLVNRPLGSYKNVEEPTNSNSLFKDPVQLTTRPLSENCNGHKPPMPLPPTDGFIKYIDPTEKENNPEVAEQLPIPKRTGRASICTTAARRMPVAPAPRRNSLIPLPSAPFSTRLPPSFLPLPPIDSDKKEDPDSQEGDCQPEQTAWSSPKGLKAGEVKKLGSILRRSLQKRIHMKSPMQQIRKGGINVGMEKVRVSIGSRGRMAYRGMLSNARRGVTMQQKQSQRDKERGWTIGGTAARTVV